MSISVDPPSSAIRPAATMLTRFVPVNGSVSAATSGVTEGLVTFSPSTLLQNALAAVGTHTAGGGVPQLLFAAVGTHSEGGGVPQLLFAAVGTHSGGGPQLLFAAVGTHSGGGPQLLFAAVGTHSGGGWFGVEQPVCAGLVRPMPWLVSHS